MSSYNNCAVPYGQTSKHVLLSRGADDDLMKFYGTTNQLNYSKKYDPGSGCKSYGFNNNNGIQSGYTSNSRVFIRYTPELDELDHPNFGKLLKDNYRSTSMIDFKAPPPPSTSTNHNKASPLSAFSEQSVIHNPKLNEVKRTRLSTCIQNGPHAGCMSPNSRKQTYLDKVLKKDPLMELNEGYGPDPTLSETRERFTIRSVHALPSYDVTVKKNGSGFTNNQNRDTLTFKPDEAYDNILPAYMTNRPTGGSTMKSDYIPYDVSDGSEPNPRISCRANQTSGFSKHIQPIEALNPYPCFDPPAEKNGELVLGTKMVKSGFTSNRVITQPWDPTLAQDGVCGVGYLTEYKYRYMDRTRVGEDREAQTYGKIQQDTALHSGYSVNNYTQQCNNIPSMQQQQHLNDYQMRSIAARDNDNEEHFYRKDAR